MIHLTLINQKNYPKLFLYYYSSNKTKPNDKLLTYLNNNPTKKHHNISNNFKTFLKIIETQFQLDKDYYITEKL